MNTINCVKCVCNKKKPDNYLLILFQYWVCVVTCKNIHIFQHRNMTLLCFGCTLKPKIEVSIRAVVINPSVNTWNSFNGFNKGKYDSKQTVMNELLLLKFTHIRRQLTSCRSVSASCTVKSPEHDSFMCNCDSSCY